VTDSASGAGREGSDGDHPLLAVEGLETHYPVTEGWLRREVGRVRAVDGVSFRIERGEAFGLVGESGSGKTTLAHTLLGLEEPTAGEVRFDGQPVGERSGAAMRTFRRRAQLVVQDPTDAFNPRMRVGEAVAEPLAIHGVDDADRREAIVTDLLGRVGLDPADAGQYPHEFSTGEQQRVAIARALVLDPDLLVLDEPTSALDGRTRTDILALLERVRREFDVAMLAVSHDIDVVRQFCERVAVMYLGEFVEKGAVDAVLGEPAHPYTRVLLDSVPSLDPAADPVARPLTETMPDPSDPPDGCRFHTRCPAVIPPEDLDLSESLWRSLAAFRFAVAAGDLPAAEGPAALRAAFDLPDPVPHDGVEAAVADALAALDREAGGRDPETAADRLAEALPTVCARTVPGDIEVEGRPVSCHRYDPEQPGEPPTR
jgi:peptide/nickel transport system ATP-binding protein